jgi:hypothetical protein
VPSYSETQAIRPKLRFECIFMKGFEEKKNVGDGKWCSALYVKVIQESNFN